MEQKKLAVEKKKTKKMLQQQAKEAHQSNRKKIEELTVEIERLESNLQVADGIIYEGNEQLQKILCAASKDIQRKDLQFVQSKIDIGLQQKKV